MPNRLPALLCALLLVHAGCERDDAAEDDLGIDGGAALRDAATVSPSEDLAASDDLAGPCAPCPCGEPDCLRSEYGGPNQFFPLQSDARPDPLQRDDGVTRDINGWIVLQPAPATPNVLWVPQTHDTNGGGTVSKIDARTVREVARYLSITCSSLAGGSPQPCDGLSGCCAADDEDRYQARLAGKVEPGHQAVQRAGNFPSRTSVDWNGDVLVANEAPGGQSSLTRIAHDAANCRDHNRNGRIDTSNDSNGNGWIDVDCNDDGVADDIAGVMARPCTNGIKQEFYGLDDECVLWTSNVFAPGASARALALTAGLPVDAWVGSHDSGDFRRVDGRTAKVVGETTLPGDCVGNSVGPNGLTIDASAIAWVPPSGQGRLCYFDTLRPANVGVVRNPPWGATQADGITMDRDQTVWLGGELARYYPDRGAGFANLGGGWWTRAGGLAVTRLAADSRTVADHWVWACTQSGVVQVPASKLPLLKADQQLMNPGWATVKMPCTSIAIDAGQYVWGVAEKVVTRALIDKVGTISQPDVLGRTTGNNVCPAGDSCPIVGADPYSDMAGYRYPLFQTGQGAYSLLVPGCRDAQGKPSATRWLTVEWDADVPPNTTLAVRARTSQAGTFADAAWQKAMATADAALSPLDLRGALTPNWAPGLPTDTQNGWLLVDITLKRSAANASPKLKSLRVVHRCPP